jgi:hypothetical protein
LTTAIGRTDQLSLLERDHWIIIVAGSIVAVRASRSLNVHDAPAPSSK